MGKRGKWFAESALAIVVWAYEALSAEPDIVIHECTRGFDHSLLQAFLVFSTSSCPLFSLPSTWAFLQAALGNGLSSFIGVGEHL